MKADEIYRESGTIRTETEAPAKRPPTEHHCVYCPNCSQRLTDHRCKLVCPNCGYYLSCADYY